MITLVFFPPSKYGLFGPFFSKKSLVCFALLFSLSFLSLMAQFRQKEEILHHGECLFWTKI